MEWNVWVIKPYGITNRQLSKVLRWGKGTYPPKYLAEVKFLSAELAVRHGSCTTVFFNVHRGDVSHAKWVHLLSQNQIQDIIMDLDSDKEKYYASEDVEDKEDPHPPSQQPSFSQPPRPDFSASSSEDQDNVGNVASQQPQPSQWTLPLNPKGVLCTPFLGPPMGKAVKLHM